MCRHQSVRDQTRSPIADDEIESSFDDAALDFSQKRFPSAVDRFCGNESGDAGLDGGFAEVLRVTGIEDRLTGKCERTRDLRRSEHVLVSPDDLRELREGCL